MGQIIAEIYEIERMIGSGGGGIVYLGRHLRLNKQVVLKADKRTLATRPEALRREVDMLKNLSHMYIPQVYDFVEQNGVVYTVMDFIQGESLDKLLDREEYPSQPQVIQWAAQLLEALKYLHSRPPHGILHGDIKPANIMLRPNGDICLIDYNIALALGEDGAVRVGASRGYASPEHYGQSFAQGSASQATETLAETEIMEKGEDGRTVTMPVRRTVTAENGSSGTGGSGRSVKLDVRSDIYSLGATLYHLLSGRCPSSNALEVDMLGPEDCSPAVSAIIKKAMAPNPDMRYQSAEEMLTAFRLLHKKDKRAVYHRRREWAWAGVLTLTFLAGGALTFIGLKQMEQRQAALTLAEYSADYLAQGDVAQAVNLALEAIPERKSIFDAPATAQAQKALTDALGVYDLSDGFKDVYTIALPSAPFQISISPEGGHIAAVYSEEMAIFETEKGRQEAVLPIQSSALSECIFVDEDRLLYAGHNGVTLFDTANKQEIWRGGEATTLAVSGDGKRAAAVNRDEARALIYQMEDGTVLAECSFSGKHLPVAANDIFANPANSIFALNQDGSLLAVSFSDGGLWIFDLENPEGDMIILDESNYSHFEGGFCGKYFAFAANKSDQSLFGLIDTEEALYAGGAESRDNYFLKADETGIYLANGNLLVKFAPDTLEEMELAYTDSLKLIGFSVDEGYVLAATEDNGFSFFDSGANQMSADICSEPCDFLALAGACAVVGNRSDPYLRVLKLESHEETQIFSYDARYAHDEARVSSDGETAMLFDFQNFCIYDKQGNLIAETKLPDPEHIYDQQYEKSDDGSWLKVIWYDGTVRRYDGGDGRLLEETREEPPAEDLYEEFYTEKYRITSPLHGVPQVYDRKSGKLEASLNEEDYLTYVTSFEEGLITEYITAAGERYGLWLNENFETLAYLPNLCDIQDGMAIFDDGSGSLRQCRLYSLQELKALGESYKKSMKRSDVNETN